VFHESISYKDDEEVVSMMKKGLALMIPVRHGCVVHMLSCTSLGGAAAGIAVWQDPGIAVYNTSIEAAASLVLLHIDSQTYISTYMVMQAPRGQTVTSM
jgi:hypothetical protein